jgi:hypothetical protein
MTQYAALSQPEKRRAPPPGQRLSAPSDRRFVITSATIDLIASTTR